MDDIEDEIDDIMGDGDNNDSDTVTNPSDTVFNTKYVIGSSSDKNHTALSRSIFNWRIIFCFIFFVTDETVRI